MIMGETTNAGDTGATGAAGSNPEETLTPQSAPLPPKEKIERVDLSQKPPLPGETAEGITPPAPKPRIPVHDMDKGVGDDIARILGDVKLPERRIEAETPPQRTYDTSLTGDAEARAAELATKQTQVREAARAVQESLPTGVPKTADDVRALHTLKDDLQDVVRNKKISLVRAVALEEDKRHHPRIEDELPAPKRSLRAPIILTLSFFLFGAAALAGTYYVLQDRTADPLQNNSQLLFAERAVPVDIGSLAPADLRREIASARTAGGLPLGAIMQIVPARAAGDSYTPVMFSEFLQAVGARAPGELVRALGNEFFFGIHTVDENAPVIVVPVTSYERAFAGMLEWEKTMNGDLSPMFTAVPMQTVSSDGLLVERTFTDDVIRNYDVRILRDESGVIQLFYSFPTRNLLIIAESEYSFAELLSRLRADRRL